MIDSILPSLVSDGMDEILESMHGGDEGMNENEIQSKLSDLSFEDLQKLKERLGTKLYKEARYGVKSNKTEVFSRSNKNKPREESSKIKPRQRCKSAKQNIRDPRFDPLCGSFKRNTFEKNYDFINEIKANEKKQLKNMLKSKRNERHIHKIKYLIERMDNQERERLKRKKQEEKKDEERRECSQSLASGKKPHFKSKFERKLGDIVEKYEELKDSGKLMKYIEKKQKRNNKKYKRYFEHNQD